MQVHFHANQTHLRMDGFAQRLVLKQRHKVTWKNGLLHASLRSLVAQAPRGFWRSLSRPRRFLKTRQATQAIKLLELTLTSFFEMLQERKREKTPRDEGNFISLRLFKQDLDRLNRLILIFFQLHRFGMTEDLERSGKLEKRSFQDLGKERIVASYQQ